MYLSAIASATTALFVRFVFKWFEPETPIMLLILLCLLPSIPVFVSLHQFSSVLAALFVNYAIFYAVLTVLIVGYRVSPFHPLAKYPGPVQAKISKLWGFWVCTYGKQNMYYRDLHKTYGPVVRIGPNELSFLDTSVIPTIMGTHGASGLPKGPCWQARAIPGTIPALIGTQTLTEHAQRRKVWDRAMNPVAVKEYEPLMIKRITQLSDGLRQRAGSPFDLAKMCSFFTFDMMGEMAFGGGFELMAENDKNGMWAFTEEGAGMSGKLGHIPHLAKLIMKLPKFLDGYLTFLDFAMNRVRIRAEKGSPTRDLFYHLIDEGGVLSQRPTFEAVCADGVLAIIAGSDTTASVISNVFFYLLQNPPDYARLRAEVDEVFPLGEGDPFDTVKLSEMKFLNAVINETMRMQPPVASGTQRRVPKDEKGRMIGNHFVPGGTAVIVPTSAYHRSPQYFFPCPDKFWPERWLKQRALSEKPSPTEYQIVHDQAAYLPFSAGPANCVGKHFAITEMRMAVAAIVQNFDLRFADGYDSADWESHLQDFFVMTKGELPVFLTCRA